MIRLSGLFIYPVKGCRGLTVTDARMDELGIIGDRRFMIVDADGKFLTQRTLPRMALIETEITAEALVLNAPGRNPLRVPLTANNATLRTVQVWSITGLTAEDCGGEAARWLMDFLGTPAGLVRIGPKFHRPVGNAGDVVSFADGYPLLVVSEASLADLNSRLTTPLPMNRFRPNLVVSGCRAFEEDQWQCFKIGEITFRNAGSCARCIVTCTDQITTERSHEPLRTLATYRRDPRNDSDVIFGQNLIHETKTGVLKVGDALTLL